ncbi:MAG: host attachment protein [bacterium]
MSKYIIVVADAHRARMFTLKESLTPETESSPHLVEQECLVNPKKKKNGAQSRGIGISGRSRTASGASYAFDDHHSKREQDELRKFTSTIVKESLKQIKKADAHWLVLVAEGKTLGLLRDTLAGIKTKGLTIHECDRELTSETPAKIQDLLAKRKLVPSMKKPEKRVRK